jgi:SPRY domain
LSQRPNLVSRSALIEQAYGLAQYEIDNVQQYDDAFAVTCSVGAEQQALALGRRARAGGERGIVVNANSKSTLSGTTPSSSSLPSSSGLFPSHLDNISDIQRIRILRHHKKILAAKKAAKKGAISTTTTTLSGGSMVSLPPKGDVGSTTSPSGTGNASAAPLPQLVTALRRIYKVDADNEDEDVVGGSSSSSSSPDSVFKTLLKSVLGHPAFSKDAPILSSTASPPVASAAVSTAATAHIRDDPTTNESTHGELDVVAGKKSTNGDVGGEELSASSAATGVGGIAAGDFSCAVESLIAELCSDSSSSTKLDSSALEHGLLIAALSVLTGYGRMENGTEEADYVAKKTDKQSADRKVLSSTSAKMTTDNDDPKTAPPLQVGSILSLLPTENDVIAGKDLFPLDTNVISYLGKAASIYEERIEIQKARLMNRLEGISLEKDTTGNKSQGGGDPVFTTPPVVQAMTSPSITTPPVVATPQPAGTPLDGSSTPDAVATEIHQDDDDPDGSSATADALSAAAVLENILAAAVNEGVPSSDEPGGPGNDGSVSNSDGEVNDGNDSADDSQDDDVDNRPRFHQLIDDDDEEDEDDDSSSSSSDSPSDDAPEEDRDAADGDIEDLDDQEETGDDDGDDLVLRQALAMSLVDQAAESQSSSSRDGDEAYANPAPEDTPSSPVTPGNATPVSTTESALGKDESPLPPIPPPPRRNPFAPSLRADTPKNDDDIEGQEDAFFFDPSALSRFGIIDADFVLVHLLRCINEKIESRRFQPLDRSSSSSATDRLKNEPPLGGIGSSLFQCSSVSRTHSRKPDTTDSAVSLQLLVALFLLVEEKRNDAIENLKKAVERQKQTAQEEADGKVLSSGEEGDDPAIAMALTYFDEEPSESKDTLEAKGMRRKAAAAAHDAAALLESRRKKTNAWKDQVKLFSYACLLSMRGLKLYLQTITRNWISDRRGLSATDCHTFIPTTTIAALSSSLDMLTSALACDDFSSVLDEDNDKVEAVFSPSQLYQEAIVLWAESTPIIYPSLPAQLAELRSLVTDHSLSYKTMKFRNLENTTTLPTTESESRVHRLRALCRRLRVSDLLDCIVPSPRCYVPETLDDEKSDKRDDVPYSHGNTVIDLLNGTDRSGALKGEAQTLCLALCHRCNVRILMWDGFTASSDTGPEESTVAAASLSSGTSILSMSPSPDLAFDSTKCSDSMAIIAGKDGADSATVPAASVHQRASKVWGTVLSSQFFMPQTGIHRFALRLDKCERGHVFVGVATSQASVRTYVGGDKYGWGVIGTQALWHDRRKIRGDYGTTFRTGSVIIVTLDTDAGTLSFSCWKEAPAGSPLSFDQAIHSPSNRRQAGGIVEEFGIAFEGLPLDSKLYPAVGLYQRDDRVTLLSVETSGNACGLDGLSDFSGGLGYFPAQVVSDAQDKTSMATKTILDVRRFNSGLQFDGMNYVKGMLSRVIENIQGGRNDALLQEVFPSLASSLCLTPQSIPILSRRLGLALLPSISRAIADIDSLVASDHSPLFHLGIQPGKWTIRATGSSGSNSDAEEYIVDFSVTNEGGTQIGIKGSGVGTTGKSKNGLVAIFGTVSGSSLSFVEEWTDALDDGFASTSGEEAASSCVVNGRVSLDGCSFEGTYRNVQFGTSGQIAGRILADSDLVSMSSLLRIQEAQQSSSADTMILQSAAGVGESLLCLAHSHLSSLICENGVDERVYDARNNPKDECSAAHAAELKDCLQLPLLASSSKSTAKDDLAQNLERLQNVYFDVTEPVGAVDLSSLLADSALQESYITGLDDGESGSISFSISTVDIVERLDGDSTGLHPRTGALAALCPSEYTKAKRLIFCALAHHCGMNVPDLDEDSVNSLWKWSFTLLEEGLRRALSRDENRSMRKKAADCCDLFCVISRFLLEFDMPTVEVMGIELVGESFSQIYKTVHSRADIDFLNNEMRKSSEVALLRLIPLRCLRNLLDSSSERHVQNVNSIESLLTGLPRLLGRGYGQIRRERSHAATIVDLGPHYLCDIPGASSYFRHSLSSTVYDLFGTVGRILEVGLLQRENAVDKMSIDSMILALATSLVTDYRNNDIDAFVNHSGVLSLIPRILRQYESSLRPTNLDGNGDDNLSVVKDIFALSQTEVSRGILRVIASLVQIVSYKTWTVTFDSHGQPSIDAAKACLDVLLERLTNLFPLVVGSVEESTSDFINIQREWQWVTFQDSWRKKSQTDAKPKLGYRVGGAGVEYLARNGLVQALASPRSPQKSSSRKSSQSSTQRGQSNLSASQSVLHQYVSQWLHIMVMASKSENSCKLLAADIGWISFLFSAVGIFVEAPTDGAGPWKAHVSLSEQTLPARYRCRVLWSLRGPLRSVKPAPALVRAILSVAGSSCGALTLSNDEEEAMVSREAVSLLRWLHSPVHEAWRRCVSAVIDAGLQEDDKTSNEFMGILCFLNGTVESLKKGSYVLLKPAAALPLSTESQALSNGKGHSSSASAASSAGSSVPHHIVGNGTEGVVAGLCRSEASAGIVSNIDMKTGICEVVLLNRNGIDSMEEQRNILTVRALRSPLSDVVQAQEVPLVIDSVFPTPNLAKHLLTGSLQILQESRYGPSGIDGEMKDVQTLHSKTRDVCSATMALRASISLLSDKKSVLSFTDQAESRKLLASALRLACPDDCPSPEKEDLLKDVARKNLATLPLHSACLAHIMSLFRRLYLEETVLDGTQESIWESRLKDLKDITGPIPDVQKESQSSEEQDNPKQDSEGSQQITPAPRNITEDTSAGRTESAAAARTTSQSTAASDNSEEDEESEAAATAAAHMREAAIAQMAELGLSIS